ncbi:uncharacterized protein LOC119068703 [Bradysia coprophila]|uniref:uncharacterized protein LOC119068703 n=1 Tax=Bradysia coprophila TaxID=38358 RepID=UPI00187D9724|nr:uncharacterized protein LOC119068703 [Bradysia coprophila]
MIKQSILLFVFFSSTKAFAINDASSNRLYHRLRRSVSVSTPNIIEINNELAEWPLNENDSIKNDLLIGQCGIRDQRVHTEDILVENSGPSTLNGTLEIYVNSPITIACVKVEDQIGAGAIPSFNSGGPGHNWIFIDVKCRYGKGFHFKIHIFAETNTTNTDIV